MEEKFEAGFTTGLAVCVDGPDVEVTDPRELLLADFIG